MALRWSCWRRRCSWRPALVGSPRPARPGCAGPLGTRAASDTRAQQFRISDPVSLKIWKGCCGDAKRCY
ncbi:rCG40823, isoform CRA_c [Rattus norvegicus]|uniref:RCG40823, isoform CRA_c n=1 Tax=Rattus norvegicus TaxID=10116 RepID=A6KRZ9_RAT|nr:rCG40823, isoform CRA_c [Rattus norvegicus]